MKCPLCQKECKLDDLEAGALSIRGLQSCQIYSCACEMFSYYGYSAPMACFEYIYKNDEFSHYDIFFRNLKAGVRSRVLDYQAKKNPGTHLFFRDENIIIPISNQFIDLTKLPYDQMIAKMKLYLTFS